ncbi:DUF362 domain-containing protein [Desulfacinum hydrothermale]|uniref:DUF362 domain-containing protein n=1 Tax=Desulfacinum hydrothermale TaxID=109258 RepID=UPI0014824153|nr:DUF362 domain-containing protein [Desulfacinum hydrothermale]
MAKVLVRRLLDYDHGLEEAVHALLEPLLPAAGLRSARVLVKPNLLAPAGPERAVVTHPAVVRAVCQWIVDASDGSAHVLVGDSPAVWPFRTVVRRSGLEDALKGLPVQVREFKDSVQVSAEPPFHSLELAREAVESDVVVNLPKWKTHSQMLLTLAVKNLFGCVVGVRKPQWHMRAGVGADWFARLLVGICRTVRPSVHLLDGILALEGDGPGLGGTARPVGYLLASPSADALDYVVCRMLGLDATQLPTLRAALSLGFEPSTVQVEGNMEAVEEFRLPQTGTVLFGPPKFHHLQRRHLLRRPEPEAARCQLCGKCWKICPAGAIRESQPAPVFDYDQCIRCFCCVEVCPFGALTPREPPLGRLLSLLTRRAW